MDELEDRVNATRAAKGRKDRSQQDKLHRPSTKVGYRMRNSKASRLILSLEVSSPWSSLGAWVVAVYVLTACDTGCPEGYVLRGDTCHHVDEAKIKDAAPSIDAGMPGTTSSAVVATPDASSVRDSMSPAIDPPSKNPSTTGTAGAAPEKQSAAGASGSKAVATVCNAGQTSCEGTSVRQCEANGSWSAGTPCPYVCKDGACSGECKPGSAQCNGKLARSCGDDGRWMVGTECPRVCAEGMCTGNCVPNAKQCSGNSTQVCNANGSWNSGEGCPFVCDKGICTGACHPNETRCSELIPEICDAKGDWQPGSTCPFVCDAGHCSGSCKPNEKRCVGPLEQTCSSTGSWSGGAVRANACDAQCTPGTTTCSGTTPQTCNEQGQWDDQPIVKFKCGATCTRGEGQTCSGTVPSTCDDTGHAVKGAITAGICGAVCTPGSPLTPLCSGTKKRKCSATGQIVEELSRDCDADCTTVGEIGCDDIEDNVRPCFGANCEVIGDNDHSALQSGYCTDEGKFRLTQYCPFTFCGGSSTGNAKCKGGSCIDNLPCP